LDSHPLNEYPGRSVLEDKAVVVSLFPNDGGLKALSPLAGTRRNGVGRAEVRPARRHTIADEPRILHERLPLVAEAYPQWATRIERLLNACDRLGAGLPQPIYAGIHRDFYADHVIVDRERLYLLDFDLYCEGDPALDVGNFLGHLIEQGLRTLGDPTALLGCQAALEDRFAQLAGEATRGAVEAYATLTLGRHVYLSTQFPERRPFTETLLDLCEQRLSVPVGTRP
jgi:hypothetical protein